LPGMGSYIALAIEQKTLLAVAWAIGPILVVIFIYVLVLFRPLVTWADRFRFEQQASIAPPKSWVLSVLRRSGIIATLMRPGALIWRRSFQWPPFVASQSVSPAQSQDRQRIADLVWIAISVIATAVALWQI